MVVEFLLAFFMFHYLRRSLKTTDLLPRWNKILRGGMIASVVLIIVGASVTSIKAFVPWLAFSLLLFIGYLIYYKEEFKHAKSVLIAVLPLLIASFLGEVVQLISAGFYQSWENYFEVADGFSFIWMIVMLFITNKQNKALAKEREKRLEEEKQNKVMATLKAELEVQVAERTAELTLQKEELQHALHELKSTQSQLIHSEKMASLGVLTAGIAHEIQNPLNFINNFSEVNTELIAEMKAEIEKGNIKQIKTIADDIAANEEKINHHGKRADVIVKGMLQHSRTSSGIKEPTDINALCDEYLRLSYHAFLRQGSGSQGLRVKDKFSTEGMLLANAAFKMDVDPTLPLVNVIPQEIGRVFLNLFNNAFWAVNEKKKQHLSGYEPIVSVRTKKVGDQILISVKDNGDGIPQDIMDKIFQPFFTTKPTGQGTGLGLSLSYDIVKAHGGTIEVKTHYCPPGGEIKVASKEGEARPDDPVGRGSEFIVQLPALSIP